MIDKKKLLQWIEDKEYVYKPMDDDREEDKLIYKGVLKVLDMLERCIDIGHFDTDEDYTPDYYDQPRFKIDAHGNLTKVESEEP